MAKDKWGVTPQAGDWYVGAKSEVPTRISEEMALDQDKFAHAWSLCEIVQRGGDYLARGFEPPRDANGRPILEPQAQKQAAQQASQAAAPDWQQCYQEAHAAIAASVQRIAPRYAKRLITDAVRVGGSKSIMVALQHPLWREKVYQLENLTIGDVEHDLRRFVLRLEASRFE